MYYVPGMDFQISIHAPRVGSDFLMLWNIPFRLQFQSTLPVWGATVPNRLTWNHWKISIHAPRVGSDSFQIKPRARNGNFNPRSPCGERRANITQEIFF